MWPSKSRVWIRRLASQTTISRSASTRAIVRAEIRSSVVTRSTYGSTICRSWPISLLLHSSLCLCEWSLSLFHVFWLHSNFGFHAKRTCFFQFNIFCVLHWKVRNRAFGREFCLDGESVDDDDDEETDPVYLNIQPCHGDGGHQVCLKDKQVVWFSSLGQLSG